MISMTALPSLTPTTYAKVLLLSFLTFIDVGRPATSPPSLAPTTSDTAALHIDLFKVGDNTVEDATSALLSALPSGFDASMVRQERTLRPASCLGWRDAGHTTDGLYTIYPGVLESSDETSNYEVYCDQNTDGGGWMLTWAYAHTGGENDPLVGGTIPTDPTGGYSHFNLNDFSGFTQSSIEGVRFKCTTSHHGRTIHFKASADFQDKVAYTGSSYPDNDVNYWNGNAGGITNLAGHNAYLPANTQNVDGHAENAFAKAPFWNSGFYHWMIGYYDRFECDDFPGSYAHTTLRKTTPRPSFISTRPSFSPDSRFDRYAHHAVPQIKCGCALPQAADPRQVGQAHILSSRTRRATAEMNSTTLA